MYEHWYLPKTCLFEVLCGKIHNAKSTSLAKDFIVYNTHTIKNVKELENEMLCCLFIFKEQIHGGSSVYILETLALYSLVMPENPSLIIVPARAGSFNNSAEKYMPPATTIYYPTFLINIQENVVMKH
jgi:hypothetical protein